MIQRLLLLGVGLIAGTLAKGLKQASSPVTISGYDADPTALSQALALGVIDEAVTDLATAVAEADMLLCAVPMGAMAQVLAQVQPYCRDDLVISDVGSSKGAFVRDARQVFGALPAGLVPGHPIAGTENSGVQAALAELFVDRKVILTPVESSAEWAVAKVRWLWQQVGANVVEMEVAHHDEVLAATSHLPHLLAYALVDCLGSSANGWEIFRYAAGGFKDFTRIASSSPTMWRDICMSNREALLASVLQFEQHLAGLRQALTEGDEAALLDCFQHAKAARDDFCQNIMADQ